MGKPEIEQFLTALAVKRGVAASTQNQALAAILVLYKEVLEGDLGWLDGRHYAVSRLETARVSCPTAFQVLKHPESV